MELGFGSNRIESNGMGLVAIFSICGGFFFFFFAAIWVDLILPYW